MPLASLKRHKDALEASTCLVKHFIAQLDTACGAELASLASEWTISQEPPFDIFAFAPVLDSIASKLKAFADVYRLDGVNLYGFVMSDENAAEATQLFDFLRFAYTNCSNKSTADKLFSYMEPRNHLFCLAANPNAATAAVLFLSQFKNRLAYEKNDFYASVAKVLLRDDFIPVYGPEYRGVSDYSCYLAEDGAAIDIQGDATIPILSIGGFKVTASQLKSLSPLELIRQGTKILPQNQWNDLIYECRKLPPQTLEGRIDMVKLHVAFSLAWEQSASPMCYDSNMQRYQDILDTELLKEYSQLIHMALGLIRRHLKVEGTNSFKYNTSKGIQNTDLVLFALQQRDASLLYAITEFYTRNPKPLRSEDDSMVSPCIFSLSASILVLQLLESLCRSAANKELQHAILLAIKCSISLRNWDFVGDASFTSVIQQFISILQSRLQLATNTTTYLDTEISRALLFVVCALVDEQPGMAVALASDGVTLKTLVAAASVVPLQANATKALCSILSVDMICYTYMDTDLWSQFTTVNDPLAVACLYNCLCASERGCALIRQFEYSNKFMESVLSQHLKAPEYSEYYYTVVAGAITGDPSALQEFASRIPEYLARTKSALDECDESQLDLSGEIFARLSKNTRVVNHLIWLLASLVHRDAVRSQLLQACDLLIEILSHQNLPYEYLPTATDNSYLHTLWNELAFGDLLVTVASKLLGKLDYALKNGNLVSAVAIAACVSPLSFKGQPKEKLASVCQNKHLENICAQLPVIIYELCQRQANFLSGSDSEIVECFWCGPGNQNSFNALGPANTAGWQLAELHEVDKLGIDMEKYEKTRSDANRVRMCCHMLSKFATKLHNFCKMAESAEIEGISHIRAQLLSGCITTLGSAPLETVQQRFSFVTFIHCFNFHDPKFVEMGGFKAAIDAYIRLQMAPRNPKELMKRYFYRYSDYYTDCLHEIEGLLKYGARYVCDEVHKDFKTEGICSGVIAMMDAIGYLFEQMSTSSFSFLPGMDAFFGDTDHDLSQSLWVQDVIVKKYRQILGNLMKSDTENVVKDVILCARFMASVLACLDRHKQVIDLLAKDLSNQEDPASIALLGALIDEKNIKYYPISRCLQSQEPTLVACTAQALRRSPVSIDADLVTIICSWNSPQVVLMLLELFTSRILFGQMVPNRETIEILVKHCLKVFEQREYDHTCLLCLTSLIDLINAALETDPEVLKTVMADLVAIQQDETDTMTCLGLESKLTKLTHRNNGVLQSTLEAHCVLDPDTQEIYWRRYVSELGLAKPLHLNPLTLTTHNLCDILMDKYIEASASLVAHGKLFWYADRTYKDTRRATSNIELSFSVSQMDHIEADYAARWENFRRAYVQARIFSDTLAHLVPRHGSATEYMICNDRFTEFIGASMQCAGIVGIFNLHDDNYQWSSYCDIEYYRNYVFWPVVHLLKFSYKECKGKVLSVIEAYLEANPTREAVFGVLYFLQVQDLNNETFHDQMQQTKIPQLCEQHVDFRSSDLRDMFMVERAYLLLTSKLKFLHGEMQKACQELGVEDTSEEDESAVQQVLDLVLEDKDQDEADEDVQEISPADQEEPQPVEDINIVNDIPDDLSDSSESTQSSLFDDLESASEDEDYYSEEEESDDDEAEEPLSSPFNVGSYTTAVPRPQNFFTIWRFDNGNVRRYERSTLSNVISYGNSSSLIPIYAWSISSNRSLLLRGLDMGRYEPPESMNSPHENRNARTKYSGLRFWPMFIKESIFADSSSKSVFQSLTRTWDCFESRLCVTDWSKLECLNRVRIADDGNTDKQEEESDDSQEREAQCQDLAGEQQRPQESIGDETSICPPENDITHYALKNALELSETPSLALSWGIDPESIRALPEELRLEVLVSWILTTMGSDMSSSDILATLDDSNYIDACDGGASDGEGKDWVPRYFGLGTRAQLNTCKSVCQDIDRLYFQKNKALKLPWSEKCILNMSYFCGRTTALYPDNVGNKSSNDLLLDFLLNNINKLSPRSVFSIISHFQTVPAGQINAIKLLQIIDMPVITCLHWCFIKVVIILKNHVSEFPAKPLETEILRRILNAFYARTLTSSARKQLMSLIELLVSREYCSNTALREIVHQDLLDQLDKCLSIASDVVDTKAFSNLETTLLTLSGHKICDLNKQNNKIVGKVLQLGASISRYIQQESSGSVQLLKCYLLLASIVKSTRGAFITFLKANNTLVNQLVAKDRTLLQKCLGNLKGHYHLINFKSRVNMVRQSYNASSESTKITLRRDHIVEDTLAKFGNMTLKENIRIAFENELGFDDGGLTREWLTLFGRELPESPLGLFRKVQTGNQFSVHPNHSSLYEPASMSLYETVGKIMGRAIAVEQPFDCPFSSVVFKALLNKSGVPLRLSLEDLERFDPELAQSMKWITSNDITDVIIDTFTCRTTEFGEPQAIELKPGGSSITVDEHNKHEYVELMIQNVYKQFEKQINAMCRGFHSVIPLKLIQIFTPPEFELLMRGTQEIDVAEWKANTTYCDYNHDSMPVKFFWQAMASVSNEDRKKVLMFATGSDCVSPLGFSSDSAGTRFVIAQQTIGNLPRSQTCISTLYLPAYSTYEDLRSKLILAIDLAGEGFGLA